MMKRMLCTFAAILAFDAGVCAQPQFGLHVGTAALDPFRITDGSPALTSWTQGVVVSASFEFAIFDALSLRTSIENNHFAFDQYRFAGTSVGYNAVTVLTSKGDDAYALRVMLEVQAQGKINKFASLELLTGVCYVGETLGEVQATHPDPVTGNSIAVTWPERRAHYVAHSLGLGLQFQIVDQIGIELLPRIYTDYSKRASSTISIGFLYHPG